MKRFLLVIICLCFGVIGCTEATDTDYIEYRKYIEKNPTASDNDIVLTLEDTDTRIVNLWISNNKDQEVSFRMSSDLSMWKLDGAAEKGEWIASYVPYHFMPMAMGDSAFTFSGNDQIQIQLDKEECEPGTYKVMLKISGKSYQAEVFDINPQLNSPDANDE